MPNPASAVQQDPKYTARSTTNQPIGIPQSALSVSRGFRVKSSVEPPAPKKRKQSVSLGAMSSNDKGVVSDEDEAEDLAFLFSDDEEPVDNSKGRSQNKLVILNCTSQKLVKSLTDFEPGSLDQSSLHLLEPPSYATSSATLRLNKELKTILKIQETTPLHELGWYIDQNLVSNVYQWIVELHSFDPKLPLAQDMKVAGITSVVLEIRFGKDYPHSPPFVRVIRPRFLPFMAGGGGHVTGGGAMCMELLTNSGWSAVSSIESVLLQVRMAISNLEPKPARLERQDKQHQNDYGVGEAVAAYTRACAAHGWEIPKDFQDFAGTGGSGVNWY